MINLGTHCECSKCSFKTTKELKNCPQCDIFYIEQSEIGEIFQKIYDSEINIRISWFWDAGFDYKVGNGEYHEKFEDQDGTLHTGETDIRKGISELCKSTIKAYPNSSFAIWFMNRNNND